MYLNLTKKCEIFSYVDEMVKTAPRGVVNETLKELSTGIKKEEFGKNSGKSFSVNINGGKLTVLIKGMVTKTHIRLVMLYLLRHSSNVFNKNCAEICCPLRQNGTCK